MMLSPQPVGATLTEHGALDSDRHRRSSVIREPDFTYSVRRPVEDPEAAPIGALPRRTCRGYSRRLGWISKALIYEGTGDLLAILLGHPFTTRNRVPPCSHARFHFIDDARSFFALK